MQKYYKYQYRFNASHSFGYNSDNVHMHTFTLTLYVSKQSKSEQIMFYDIDKVVNKYLKQYEQSYLNEKPEFTDKEPNIENIGDTFFEELKTWLSEIEVDLYQLDIYENPLSIYQVSSRIHLPPCYIN